MSDYTTTLITIHLLAVLYIAYRVIKSEDKGEKND
jgi:cbb3-type cytochrome oxidase subunit 3